MTKMVRDYMTARVRTIGAHEPLAVAHRYMRQRGVRHLPVLDGDRLVGLVSMGDLHLMETLRGIDPEAVTVDEAMTPAPYTVSLHASLGKVSAEMARRKYGSAVVVDAGRVVGIFTAVDGLRALAELLGARRRRTPAAHKARAGRRTARSAGAAPGRAPR